MDPFIPLSIALVVLLAINFRALKAFDELVEVLYEFHWELWVAHGRPIGTFWRPEDPEVKLVTSLVARTKLRNGLMLRTPGWIPEDSPAHLKIATWRVTTLVGWAGLALLGLGLAAWGALST